MKFKLTFISLSFYRKTMECPREINLHFSVKMPKDRLNPRGSLVKKQRCVITLANGKSLFKFPLRKSMKSAFQPQRSMIPTKKQSMKIFNSIQDKNYELLFVSRQRRQCFQLHGALQYIGMLLTSYTAALGSNPAISSYYYNYYYN